MKEMLKGRIKEHLASRNIRISNFILMNTKILKILSLRFSFPLIIFTMSFCDVNRDIKVRRVESPSRSISGLPTYRNFPTEVSSWLRNDIHFPSNTRFAPAGRSASFRFLSGRNRED